MYIYIYIYIRVFQACSVPGVDTHQKLLSVWPSGYILILTTLKGNNFGINLGFVFSRGYCSILGSHYCHYQLIHLIVHYKR